MFNGLHKQALRAALFAEQRHLCVFCERLVSEPVPPLPKGVEPPPIDHWRPLSVYLLEAFDWSNLHVSCQALDTCDDRKKDTDIQLPLPSTYDFENVLGFTSGGQMYVRKDVAIPATIRAALELALDDVAGPTGTTASTLNLNQPALRAAREAAIEDEETAMAANPPGAAGVARAAQLLALPQRPEFVSARVAWLLGRIHCRQRTYLLNVAQVTDPEPTATPAG